MPNQSDKIIDPSQVIIVEASAGSGKTYYLAKRYLQLAINFQPYFNQPIIRNILAITFSNKATVEMKERILELLKKIALDDFSNEEEEKDIMALFNFDKSKVQQKALYLMDEITRRYNFFQVQTIDSFINNLLLGSAFNINRSANFKIKKDYNWQLNYSLDLVIEQATINTEIFDFLEEFLEHYLFVENRKSWFPKKDIQELMKFFFQLGNKYGKEFKLAKGSSEEVIKKKKHIYSQIKDLIKNPPSGMNKTAFNSLKNFIEKNDSIFEIDNLPNSFQHSAVPMNKEETCDSTYRQQWKKVCINIRKLIELDAEVAYNPYIKLFGKLRGHFQEASWKEDVIFLEELNQKARYLFGSEGVTVAELYYRLATRFLHYLIDEFQDTSILQWQNLELMVEEGLACGGSLFCVGDKKQAIFRFRGGEVELFEQIKNRYRHFKVQPMSLTKNWRSQRIIVEFNNKIFSRENLLNFLELSGIAKELKNEAGAIEEILNIFKDAKQQYKKENNDGYVYIEPISENDQAGQREITRSKVLELVEDLETRFNYADIAILARDNREVELITSWLLEANYPVESDKTLNVIKNPLVKELVSLLKFLHSPVDDLNFAAFILGSIFSRVAKIKTEDIVEFILSTYRRKANNNSLSLYHIFRKFYPEFWEKYFSNLFRKVGFISTYELLIDIYKQFDLVKNFIDSQAFFMKFLELIKVQEEEYIGLGDFLDYLKDAPEDELFVNITAGNSIKVLTIHKSKGLEFGVVILPFLRLDIKPASGGKGINSYVDSHDALTLELKRITKSHIIYSPFLQTKYRQAFKKACIDELNNIYVAQTRAKFELYIFIPRKSGSSINKAFFMIPESLRELGSKKKYSASKKISNPLLELSPQIYKDWSLLLQDDFDSAGSIKNRMKMIEGNIMHSILSQVGNCDGNNLDKIIDFALTYVKTKFNIFENINIYKEKLEKILTSQNLKELFYVGEARVYCEKELANRFGDLKRVDRLIVSKKQILVVDFKIKDVESEEYRNQIKEYMLIVKDIYPNHIVKGFLVYLAEVSKEEILG
ncbi:MAG: UvrD-helicase domain-containing protein [Candidatus Omnitrophica bacterium]|jgi:ATP-dependent exoDNAse (exonuclease V) beta subunit|nr:UvrD-helicase domain-containing protein [Candidatus Omnitrophota bacterium]